MPPANRASILLISRAPELHHELIRTMHLAGYVVCAARRAPDALALLRRHPAFVFVDLTANACLTPALVQAINRESGSKRVAIHSGDLESAGAPATRLTVDGFWRAGQTPDAMAQAPISRPTHLSIALN